MIPILTTMHITDAYLFGKTWSTFLYQLSPLNAISGDTNLIMFRSNIQCLCLRWLHPFCAFLITPYTSTRRDMRYAVIFSHAKKEKGRPKILTVVRKIINMACCSISLFWSLKLGLCLNFKCQ